MTVVTRAMYVHAARRNGSTKREPVDIAFRPAKEAQHPEQVDQDKTEDVAKTPCSSKDQDKTEEMAVHKEAQRILRMMKEAMMPKKTQCSNQEQDKTEEAQRLDQTGQ